MRSRTYARDLPDLRTGVYRDWEGHFYLVSGYAYDANYPGRIVVTYIGLELDDVNLGPRPAVREVDDFFALVCGVTGKNFYECACRPDGHDSKPVHRFEYVGPSWYGWPRSTAPAAALPDELAATGVPDTQPGRAWTRCAVWESHEPHEPCPGVPARYPIGTRIA